MNFLSPDFRELLQEILLPGRQMSGRLNNDAHVLISLMISLDISDALAF